ncbi:formylglycine-generating enzyme family protein [Streptosporangium sp. NBC_01469]|uniref:formylglycine-generating enzyme family protein n=1 Tax=Streptosporangium sp. NBC_01469 TaxID=2903898 RepID=UPI002E2D3C2F|nr:formylglycine-generating enzyme family protein [Streptosporangium sp. NBC_01469]
MSPEPTPPQEIAERMIEIPAGKIFLRDEGTKAIWKVEVGAFLLASHPVTRELYRAVRGEGGETPASPAGPRTPVTEVSWQEAVRFCNLLSEAAGLDPCYSMGDDRDGQDVVCDWEAGGYRLPSEAEWEYACRAGTSGVCYGELDEIAWYGGNSGGEVHDVATRAPNAWGLHDMIGNVWEWCWDLYDPGVYGPYRVFRGGGAYDLPRGCRASCRRKSHPTFRVDDLGFRLARSR